MQKRNWAGNVVFRPQECHAPGTVDEVVAIVKKARLERKVVRVVGAGHSFSPLIKTDDVFLDLSRIKGMIEVDRQSKRVTLFAGTSIKDATRQLAGHGLALANQGDIDRQSLAGAFSTGTHGTGFAYASLANFITAMEFVDGTGTLQKIDTTTEGDLLNAAKVALGAFGILTKVTVQCVDSFILRCTHASLDLESCLATIEPLTRDNAHFEFFWFPYSPMVQLKTLNPVKEESRRPPVKRYINERILERFAFGSLCELARIAPTLAPAISRFCGSINPDTDFAEPSYKVFPSERDVVFTEMEYALPVAAGPACFRDIKSLIESRRIPVFFPIEYRVAGKDAAWISPMYGRESAILSLHTFKGFRQDEFFSGAEEILKRHGGRPHWGKLHRLTSEELPHLYNKWPEFCALRARFDPDRVFCNELLSSYFPR